METTKRASKGTHGSDVTTGVTRVRAVGERLNSVRPTETTLNWEQNGGPVTLMGGGDFAKALEHAKSYLQSRQPEAFIIVEGAPVGYA